MRALFVITNNHSEDLSLVLEPWVDEAVVHSGDTAVSFEGPDGGRVDVVAARGRLVFGGGVGSLMSFKTEKED